MEQANAVKSPIESVRSTLNYIIPGEEKPVTQSNLPGEVRVTSNTGKYQAHPVTIRNGRLVSGFTLDKEGFILVKHETKVKDFYNDDEVKRVYYPEIEQLVKQSTGAARVLVFDHTLRAENDAVREEKFASRPVRSVHNDYTEWSGPQRVRDLLPKDEAETLLRNRFSVIQVWRPVRNPVVSAPLAIADSQSIAANDLIGTERRYPDRVGEIYHLSYNADHRWFYFPDMQTDEAIVFKCYDSLKDGRARWSAHAAFDDPNSPANAPARESIEMRTLAFFD
ncbi:MAG TPA: CmcJ/NvfI family oxidoreductase [Candidatus Binatia bacterium]|nr:CmcJ/NvfI family oxidoreductase [Candidatus Binatia bacterium]